MCAYGGSGGAGIGGPDPASHFVDRLVPASRSPPGTRIARCLSYEKTAFVERLLIYYVLRVVNVFLVSWYVVGLDAESFLLRLPTELLSNFGLGATGVYAGSRVAPSHKRLVAWALTGLVVLFSGFLLFPAVFTAEWWAILAAVALALGAGHCLRVVTTATERAERRPKRTSRRAGEQCRGRAVLEGCRHWP
jgi:hypothetical protein